MPPTSRFILSFMIFILVELHRHNLAVAEPGGRWDLLQKSIGIVALHMQLLNNDRVVIFDRTDFGPSNISLPKGKCRYDPNKEALKKDCTAHSVEFNVLNNSVRPLMVQTDVWCSSGALAPDGHLIQAGGFNDGERFVRTFYPCNDCDWNELGPGLITRRWYATIQMLLNGQIIVVGGRGKYQYSYEFFPKTSPMDNQNFSLPFLREVKNGKSEDNLYPFVHLNTDGNLFIFANNRSILLDYKKHVIVKTYPTIPGGDPRTYPSTGSSVLLPLTSSPNSAEVLICGGAPFGSYHLVNTSKTFLPTLSSCGRIKINDESPQWVMEEMPMARCMGDMVLLPTGNVFIVNGVGLGTAGWENGKNPVLNPVLYIPNNPYGARFEVLNPSTIPRVYHSTAILLRDGRVLVGGSNPHIGYNFTGVQFPTELSLEAYLPEYLSMEFTSTRPTIIQPVSQTKINYGQKFNVVFSIIGAFNSSWISVTMVAPPFNTHSFSMNQRLLVLETGKEMETMPPSTYQVEVSAPSSYFFALSGYYMMFVNHLDIPSEGIWVHLS